MRIAETKAKSYPPDVHALHDVTSYFRSAYEARSRQNATPLWIFSDIAPDAFGGSGGPNWTIGRNAAVGTEMEQEAHH